MIRMILKDWIGVLTYYISMLASHLSPYFEIRLYDTTSQPNCCV